VQREASRKLAAAEAAVMRAEMEGADRLEKAEASHAAALGKLREEHQAEVERLEADIEAARVALSEGDAREEALRKSVAAHEEHEATQAAELEKLHGELRAHVAHIEKARRSLASDRAALLQTRAAVVALSKQIEDATAEPVE
jgi:chromosome segregation ATPase